jgi:two-component system, NarL family, response regulator LiaR
MISKGYSNKEISKQLYITEGTLRNNISALLSKLNLRDRTQLAVFFIRKLEE